MRDEAWESNFLEKQAQGARPRGARMQGSDSVCKLRGCQARFGGRGFQGVAGCRGGPAPCAARP
jgi:hypothetical protein